MSNDYTSDPAIETLILQGYRQMLDDGELTENEFITIVAPLLEDNPTPIDIDESKPWLN